MIYPKVEIGKFRGEAVYPRSNVVPLKTSENWIRIGRRVKEGEQPMKLVKYRAVTINRRRALEMGRSTGAAETDMQGLYAENQTELYIPDPVVNVSITIWF